MASLIVDAGDDVLTNIHTAQVTSADMRAAMGRELTDAEKKLLAEFEQSWKFFVKSKQGNLPAGSYDSIFNELQGKVEISASTRDDVEQELERQIQFFKESLVTMEASYSEKIHWEKDDYDNTKQKLTENLEAIRDADELQEETLPWFFFLSCVEAEARKKYHGFMPKTRVVKPSCRATYLLSLSEEEFDDREALQMDHALLKAHLRMLNKEIQRYEKTLAAQEHAGQFMTENNIWNVLE